MISFIHIPSFRRFCDQKLCNMKYSQRGYIATWNTLQQEMKCNNSPQRGNFLQILPMGGFQGSFDSRNCENPYKTNTFGRKKERRHRKNGCIKCPEPPFAATPSAQNQKVKKMHIRLENVHMAKKRTHKAKKRI